MLHKFRCGDRVHDAVDPRHIGRVIAILDQGVTIRVEWIETKWISDLAYRDVRRAPADD